MNSVSRLEGQGRGQRSLQYDPEGSEAVASWDAPAASGWRSPSPPHPHPPPTPQPPIPVLELQPLYCTILLHELLEATGWAAGPPQRVLDAPSAGVWSRPLPRQVQLRPLPPTPSSQLLAPVSTLQHLIWETVEFLSHFRANGWIFQDLLQPPN